MPRYRVVVDDNFHYMESDARWEKGTYETIEEALAACRGIVDQSLAENFEPGVSAEALYEHYVSFGDDPFSWCSTAWMTAPNSRPGVTQRSAAARCARITKASEIPIEEIAELRAVFGEGGEMAADLS
jgi:hypothetical protein